MDTNEFFEKSAEGKLTRRQFGRILGTAGLGSPRADAPAAPAGASLPLGWADTEQEGSFLAAGRCKGGAVPPG